MVTYGAAVLLGIGGSTLLVTVLTMLADLIGENVVSCFLLLSHLNIIPLTDEKYLMWKGWTSCNWKMFLIE